MRAKAKKAPMCSVSLIAIKLKGVAAPGEALKNIVLHISDKTESGKLSSNTTTERHLCCESSGILPKYEPQPDL